MSTISKATQTFSLDKEVLAEVKRTKGKGSASERANHLLKFALDLEKKTALHEEAAGFFPAGPAERDERRGHQRASVRSRARDRVPGGAGQNPHGAARRKTGSMVSPARRGLPLRSG